MVVGNCNGHSNTLLDISAIFTFLHDNKNTGTCYMCSTDNEVFFSSEQRIAYMVLLRF